MARTLSKSGLEHIEARIVNGQNIFELYSQINKTLEIEAGAELRHFFSEPQVSQARGEIVWRTQAVGAPLRLGELDEADRQRVSELLQNKCDVVRQVIQKIEKASKGSTTTTEALKNMLITPDIDHSVFVVGEHLVLTEWGCHQYGKDVRDFDLTEQIRRKRKPAPAEQNGTMGPSPAPTGEGGNPEAVVTPPQETLEPAMQPLTDQSDTVAEEKPFEEPVQESEEPQHNPPEEPQEPDEPQQPEEPKKPEEPEGPVGQGYLAITDDSGFYWRWLVLLLLLLLLLLGLLLKDWRTSSESELRDTISRLKQQVDDKVSQCNAKDGTDSRPPALSEPPTGNQQSQTEMNPGERDSRLDERGAERGSAANVSLLWNDNADLDLEVVEPSGSRISIYEGTQSTTGGKINVDENLCTKMSGCSNAKASPVENVIWTGKPSPGKYRVVVNLFSANATPDKLKAIDYTVIVTLDGQDTSYKGTFHPNEMKCNERCTVTQRQVTEFDIR
jgi:hypothetical protein